MAVAAMTLPVFFSCSGGGGSASESVLFGEVPAIYGEMQETKDALKEEYKTCDSESEAKSIMEKADKLNEEYAVKIEEAAKALDGKEISFSESDIKVTSPVSLTFEKFFSKIDLTPYFKVNGSAEAAKDVTFDCDWAAFNVEIVGYGSDGQELFSSKVGLIDAVVGDGQAVVKAGTPVKFDYLQFGKKKVAEYQQASSLKLEIRK